MKPHLHAESSARRFGGRAEDYLEIHRFMDSSKGAIADHRHRVLTHNAWFVSVVLERVFGYSIRNSDGQNVSVRDIGEQHVLEDFRGGFIPSVQDWLGELPYRKWMDNGKELPPSLARFDRHTIASVLNRTKPSLLRKLGNFFGFFAAKPRAGLMGHRRGPTYDGPALD